MIRVLFTTRPAGLPIRLVTWSDFSHCALIDGDSVIEAVAFHGVRRRPLDDAIADADKAIIVSFECDTPQGVIGYAASQIGKGYDYTALLGLWLHRNWQEDDAWFCSELIAASFYKAGCPLFRPDAMHRITPQHIYQLLAKETVLVK